MTDEAMGQSMGGRTRDDTIRHHNVEKMLVSCEALFKEVLGK